MLGVPNSSWDLRNMHLNSYSVFIPRITHGSQTLPLITSQLLAAKNGTSSAPATVTFATLKPQNRTSFGLPS